MSHIYEAKPTKPDAELQELRATNARLRAALEFYADQDNWTETPSRNLAESGQIWNYTTIWKDSSEGDAPVGGKRARATLSSDVSSDLGVIREAIDELAVHARSTVLHESCDDCVSLLKPLRERFGEAK